MLVLFFLPHYYKGQVMLKFCVKFFNTSIFAIPVTDLVHPWYV